MISSSKWEKNICPLPAVALSHVNTDRRQIKQKKLNKLVEKHYGCRSFDTGRKILLNGLMPVKNMRIIPSHLNQIENPWQILEWRVKTALNYQDTKWGNVSWKNNVHPSVDFQKFVNWDYHLKISHYSGLYLI